MAVKTFTLDADFDITLWPNLLTKSDNIALKLNQAVELDGTNDRVSVDGLLTECANHTVGSIALWAKVDSDDGNINAYFSISRDASATETALYMYMDLRTGGVIDVFAVFLGVDGTRQWTMVTANNSTDAYIGIWHHICLVQDGTAPVLYLNGVAQAVTWPVEVDKTKWLKAIITDAVSKADAVNIGIYETNGSDSQPFDGQIDKFQVYDYALSSIQVAALAAERPIEGSDTASGLVCNLHFRGNANDVSGEGNNGTLESGAAVANATLLAQYATSSPVAYLIEAGNEYAIDAGAGNYVDVSAVADTEIAPAGTSIKFQYALADTSTRAGVSWNGSWLTIADLNTNLSADAAKKRYLHLKAQLNENDGDAAPTLSDLSVTYTTPAVGKIVKGLTGVNRNLGPCGINSKILSGVA